MLNDLLLSGQLLGMETARRKHTSRERISPGQTMEMNDQRCRRKRNQIIGPRDGAPDSGWIGLRILQQHHLLGTDSILSNTCRYIWKETLRISAFLTFFREKSPIISLIKTVFYIAL